MNHRAALTLCLSVVLYFAGCGANDVATDVGPSPPALDNTLDPGQGTPAADTGESKPEQEASASDAGESKPATEPEPSAPTSDVASATPSADPDSYWPRFHGPKGDNLSEDTGLLASWPSEGPPLAWEVEGIGYGYSSVSIANGLIYTAGNKDDKTIISAIDLSGNVKWQVPNGPAYEAAYPGTRGTPTLDGDRLYHQSPVGNIICVKAGDGTQIWTINTLKSFGAENIEWALSESLLIDGDHVITCPGGKDASVAALNKMTGETVWTAESTGDKTGYATPSVAECDGLRIIFTMTAKALIGVSADTGKLLFRYPFETKLDANTLKPILHEGHVFISGGYGTTGSDLLKVNVNGDTASVEQVWRSTDLDNLHGGVLLVDGHLYGASDSFNGGKWVCLDWKTGEMKWAARGVGKGSLTCADGMLYTLSDKRNLGIAKATPEAFELVSKFRIPSGGNGATWAHPVVCGGRLYIRHDDKLFAYHVKASG